MPTQMVEIPIADPSGRGATQLINPAMVEAIVKTRHANRVILRGGSSFIADPERIDDQGLHTALGVGVVRINPWDGLDEAELELLRTVSIEDLRVLAELSDDDVIALQALVAEAEAQKPAAPAAPTDPDAPARCAKCDVPFRSNMVPEEVDGQLYHKRCSPTPPSAQRVDEDE